MKKDTLILVGVNALLILICFAFLNIKVMSESKKIKKMNDEFNSIIDRVQVLDVELRIKDSFLLRSIEVNMAYIQELSTIRERSWKDIDSIKAVIVEDRKIFEQNKNDLLSW